MTATEITNYLVNEYGECKHDAYAMSEAIMDMAYELEYDNEQPNDTQLRVSHSERKRNY